MREVQRDPFQKVLLVNTFSDLLGYMGCRETEMKEVSEMSLFKLFIF